MSNKEVVEKYVALFVSIYGKHPYVFSYARAKNSCCVRICEIEYDLDNIPLRKCTLSEYKATKERLNKMLSAFVNFQELYFN